MSFKEGTALGVSDLSQVFVHCKPKGSQEKKIKYSRG